MKLEQQVTSLELSKKLKELGVKQESLYYWVGDQDKQNWKLESNDFIEGFESENWKLEKYSAFTVAELGKELPMSYEDENGTWFLRFGETLSDIYYISYPHGNRKHNLTHHENADTETNARAKMRIYLIENKLIDITK